MHCTKISPEFKFGSHIPKRGVLLSHYAKVNSDAACLHVTLCISKSVHAVYC